MTAPFCGANKIAAVDLLGGLAGKIVLLRIKGLPIVVRQALVALQGRLDAENFHIGIAGPAMDPALVKLEKGSAAVGLIYIHAGHAQLLPVRLAHLTQVWQFRGTGTIERIIAKIHLYRGIFF